MRNEPVGDGTPVCEKLRAAGGRRRVVLLWRAMGPTQAIVGIRRVLDCAGVDCDAE